MILSWAMRAIHLQQEATFLSRFLSSNLSVTFSGISQANNQTTTFIDLWSLENAGANLGASAEEWQTSRI